MLVGLHYIRILEVHMGVPLHGISDVKVELWEATVFGNVMDLTGIEDG